MFRDSKGQQVELKVRTEKVINQSLHLNDGTFDTDRNASKSVNYPPTNIKKKIIIVSMELTHASFHQLRAFKKYVPE